MTHRREEGVLVAIVLLHDHLLLHRVETLSDVNPVHVQPIRLSVHLKAKAVGRVMELNDNMSTHLEA